MFLYYLIKIRYIYNDTTSNPGSTIKQDRRREVKMLEQFREAVYLAYIWKLTAPAVQLLFPENGGIGADMKCLIIMKDHHSIIISISPVKTFEEKEYS